MRAALDTNVLAYVEGVNGDARRRQTVSLLQRISSGSALVPAQALGELFHVLVRKARVSPANAREAVLAWEDGFAVIPTTLDVLVAALDVATDHKLAIWDAVIISAAAEAGCRVLLSEDLQDGFTWRGVTVVNPFAPEPHDLLAELLQT